MTKSHPLYLDWNATAPMLPEALEAVHDYSLRAWGNPSSPHGFGRSAAAALSEARGAVAGYLGRPSSEVVFTSGATESNAIALMGIGPANTTTRIASAIEHPSVLGWATDFAQVDENGLVDLEHLDRLLTERENEAAIVSVMAANNETGVLQPTGEVAALCRRHGAIYHCDATQVVGRVEWDLSEPDMVSLSAHKFGGPKGTGVLASRIAVRTNSRGGLQEGGARPGTVNVPGVMGMAIAIQRAGPQSPTDRNRLEEVAIELGGRVVSRGAPRLPNTSCVVFPVPGDLLVMALDLAGIACSTGSACASGAPGRSHVMKALGVEGIPVRFSLGPGVDISGAIKGLVTVYERVRRECV